MQQLEGTQATPGPEAGSAPAMTAAQRAAIYGESPNASQRTSNVSQAQAEAKQKELQREKQHQDALNSDTVAIDFARPTAATTSAAASQEQSESSPKATAESAGPVEKDEAKASTLSRVSAQQEQSKNRNPMAPYDFDTYDGRLYRVFEGTVLEGVVTNRIDGGLSGPILVMLTTD